MHAQSIQKPQHVNAPVGIASGKIGPAFPETDFIPHAHVEPYFSDKPAPSFRFGDEVRLRHKPHETYIVVGLAWYGGGKYYPDGCWVFIIALPEEGDAHPHHGRPPVFCVPAGTRLYGYGALSLGFDEIMAADTFPRCPVCNCLKGNAEVGICGLCKWKRDRRAEDGVCPECEA